MDKVGFFTEFHSSIHYINEIPVEGNKRSRLYFQVACYGQYSTQDICARNTLTLLRDTLELIGDN